MDEIGGTVYEKEVFFSSQSFSNLLKLKQEKESNPNSLIDLILFPFYQTSYAF